MMAPNPRNDSMFSMQILSVLAREDSYGYQIQKLIKEASGGRIALGPGSLYRLLRTLEDQGAIRSWKEECNGRQRKWYRLTPAGRRRLDRQSRRWYEHFTCLWRLKHPDSTLPGLETGDGA